MTSTLPVVTVTSTSQLPALTTSNTLTSFQTLSTTLTLEYTTYTTETDTEIDNYQTRVTSTKFTTVTVTSASTATATMSSSITITTYVATTTVTATIGDGCSSGLTVAAGATYTAYCGNYCSNFSGSTYFLASSFEDCLDQCSSLGSSCIGIEYYDYDAFTYSGDALNCYLLSPPQTITPVPSSNFDCAINIAAL